jgi:hypothetical protein
MYPSDAFGIGATLYGIFHGHAARMPIASLEQMF